MLIAQLSDVHVGGGRYREGLLRAAIEEINTAGPDLVVVAGDLTDEGYPDQYPLAKEELSAWACPLIVRVPGNHDARNSAAAPTPPDSVRLAASSRTIPARSTPMLPTTRSWLRALRPCAPSGPETPSGWARDPIAAVALAPPRDGRESNRAGSRRFGVEAPA
jgi:hypothetical protein